MGQDFVFNVGFKWEDTFPQYLVPINKLHLEELKETSGSSTSENQANITENRTYFQQQFQTESISVNSFHAAEHQ